MGWTLTSADEHFSHQVPFPHAMVGSSDPNWRERYWISLHDVATQRFILSAGFGKYPNQDVMEAFAIAQAGDSQRNLRVSRQLLPDVEALRVGPMSVEVLVPLETLRFEIAPNASGISGRFTWHAAMPAMLEGRHFEINRSRVSHDLARYVQLGRVEGTLTIGDDTFALDPETTWAERDHSWGIRPMAPFPGEAPPKSVDWNFLAFCPIQFPQFCVHFYLFESQAGRPTHLSATLLRKDGGGEGDPIEAVEHDFEWLPDAPVLTLLKGSIRLRLYSGRCVEITIRGLAPRAYLRGGGYGVDHGRWKGESSLEHEVWDLKAHDQLPKYFASSSDHLVEARCDGETGYGIIEYMVRRAHEKYAPALPPSRRAA
jgi:hypothetical protein